MAFCTRQVSASEIARRIGIHRTVLYKWKDEIIGNSTFQTFSPSSAKQRNSSTLT